MARPDNSHDTVTLLGGLGNHVGHLLVPTPRLWIRAPAEISAEPGRYR